MSRIGNRPVDVGDGVSVDISADNLVTVKGPKGALSVQVSPEILVTHEEGAISVRRSDEQKRYRALHGLYCSLIGNAVEGVTKGYRKQLEVIGVGYRAAVSNGVLELALGFSHPIYFVPPTTVSVSVEAQRGQNTIVTIEGIDKQIVGQVAAKIRALRPPEPYKGKGIRYVGEYVRRKAGKTAAR